MLPKVITEPARENIQLKFISRSCFGQKMQEEAELTFLWLHSVEIRVKFFDDVRSVFNGLFRYVALPLPEAELKGGGGECFILCFADGEEKKNPSTPCSCWPLCGPPPRCRL